MTKPRPPISIDTALARIAGELPGGWAEMARVVDRHESTVRRWGDHDQAEQISLPAAIALDIAYQRAGGQDRPLFDTYALQTQLAREKAFANEVQLARHLCVLMRECAQSHEAMVLVTLPDADNQLRTVAISELEDVVREATALIAMVRNVSSPPDTS